MEKIVLTIDDSFINSMSVEKMRKQIEKEKREMGLLSSENASLHFQKTATNISTPQ